MGIFDYEVIQIDGDYAHLRNLDRPEDELKLVARALLPQEIQEGSRLHYECFEYTRSGRRFRSAARGAGFPLYHPWKCAKIQVFPAKKPLKTHPAKSGENP